jgi:predicted nuclease of predicted toxin-antitoxin system
MRFLIDENMSDPLLAARLRARGHDPTLAQDVGLLSAADPRVLIWAIGQALPMLTRDTQDFRDLHELILVAGGHHPGLLLVCFDNDSRHNLSDRAIATAISKLESSGVPIADQLHVLNQWR